MTMDELYKQYPFRSEKKLMAIAKEHGIGADEVRKFSKGLVRDHRFNQKDYFLPIYSERPDAYQFDTLEQTRGTNPRYFLVFIGVNNRKLYVYPMESKGKNDVLDALKKFKNEVGKISNLTSDQDTSYLSDEVVHWMAENNIDYRTTEDHDHNRLGIINRVMRTLRDMNQERNFTIESMNKCVRAYNNSEHSSIGMKPNQFDEKDEDKYVYKKRLLSDSIKSTLPIGSHARVVEDKNFSKRRGNLSQRAYLIDSIEGNQYILRAKDDSVATYPRHKLYLDNKAPMAETIDDAKRGIINSILDYKLKGKTPKYRVEYVGGVKDWIPMRNLREGRPSKMSQAEKEYWKGKNIPKEIMI